MPQKSKIKVIKKSESSSSVTSNETDVTDEKKTKQAAAREMVANVTTWVTEFQQRRRTETKKAFESLFSQQTPTTN